MKFSGLNSSGWSGRHSDIPDPLFSVGGAVHNRPAEDGIVQASEWCGLEWLSGEHGRAFEHCV